MGTRRDTASWMFLHDGMPDHPKIEGLSDRAFRTLIELWCYCSRHLTDGYVTEQAWIKRTTPKVRRELIEAGLADEVFPRADDGISTESRRDGVVMHDYLDWQRSAEEAAEFTSTKRAAGGYGNHMRWHVRAGKTSPDCKFCVEDDPGRGSQEPSHVRSQMGSHSGSQTDRKPIAEERRGEKKGSVGRERHLGNAGASRATDPAQASIWPASVSPRRNPGRCPEHASLPPGAYVPPCGECAALREGAETSEHEAAASRAAELAEYDAAVAACTERGRCDGTWVLEYAGGPPVDPAVRCDHGLRRLRAV
jgi:hypothetical protein